jgi:hypothetical protein
MVSAMFVNENPSNLAGGFEDDCLLRCKAVDQYRASDEFKMSKGNAIHGQLP